MAKPGKKRARRRVPREERRNLRLWAEGARETVLLPHVEAYGEAMERGWIKEREYLQRVCREYHARLDWRLADHDDPGELAPFDPDAILPPPEKLAPEDQVRMEQRKQELDDVSVNQNRDRDLVTDRVDSASGVGSNIASNDFASM